MLSECLKGTPCVFRLEGANSKKELLIKTDSTLFKGYKNIFLICNPESILSPGVGQIVHH